MFLRNIMLPYSILKIKKYFQNLFFSYFHHESDFYLLAVVLR